MTMCKSLYMLAAIPLLCSLGACGPNTPAPSPVKIPNASDVHSYAKPNLARVTHLSLDLAVDFDTRILQGLATYDIWMDTSATEIILDVNDLEISTVQITSSDGQMKETTYRIGDQHSFLGAPLHIDIATGTKSITIQYQTSPDALALQWLSPQQTHDKTSPFLFTQGQAILTRTWIPCQDSPGIRYTYDATIKVPPNLMALMSASNPQNKSDDGVYHFEMKQAIPAYLMALAIGDIAYSAISDRTGVYAEPGMLDAATYEMGDLEKMVSATEALYGPYRWDRYDLIVLPPSFPFGGMENPRLTFATPTIIAGDRSLTALVAHELAHSWSGNLVTNATWDDFWLNEGHTVYIERRIMESLYGRPYVDMLSKLGIQDLEETINDLGPNSKDTHLKLDLAGRDPDEGMTNIAYEKGFLLLYTLEQLAGRERFDAYLKDYFDTYRFKSLSTEQWVDHIRHALIDQYQLDFDLNAWVYQPGLPDNRAVIESNKFVKVDERAREFNKLARLDKSNTRAWSTHEWLHFIRQLPIDLHVSLYDKLDDVYDLSNSGNSEILAAWLENTIRSGYMEDHNKAQLEQFLIGVGRRKFLTPLYRALKESDQLLLAKSIFERAKANYHSVSALSIEALLNEPLELG